MQGSSIEVKEEIPMYHKMAICDIPSHSPVFKYGEKIGVAVKDIFAGEHVHVHNLKSGDENVFLKDTEEKISRLEFVIMF